MKRHQACELFGIIEFRSTRTKRLRHFHGKPDGHLDITFLAGTRRRTGYGNHANDVNSNDWGIGARSRLHDAVQMKHAIPIRGNILCGNCEGSGANGSVMKDHASVGFGRSIVQRTAFRQTDQHPLCQLVHKFQIELQRPGDHHGGTRHFTRSHDHPALDPALLAGIREALEALRSASRRILEEG
jgi:hypothetical protein